MPLREFLGPEQVVVDLKATTKKQVLIELATIAAEKTNIEKRVILDTLLQRERLGSTGVGKGIAIPHGRLEGLDTVYGVFARLTDPVDFDAVDDEPVDLVFLLLAPEDEGGDHLKALAKVSRCLRDQEVCGCLREALTAAAAHEILAPRIDDAA
ncbi:MAG: PTS IIA-like nitrogen regulatory protein PtsN [Alphaproteobacteria bacterium]|nr:PTS IIA-like nitrogen regulatory protein PtsN [Alphaproteobacteria bacterium]